MHSSTYNTLTTDAMRRNAHATDPELSEDASFVATVSLPVSKGGNLQQFTFLGVADGVGSWREYNVDPREFSHTFMEECRAILMEAAEEFRNSSSATNNSSNSNLLIQQVMTPAVLMAQAYERVKARNIIGSCTACIALFDSVRHQLHFSNLGDSGLILLRHIDSDVAGSLKRVRNTPRPERKSDLQISFVSQQQLRSFNHPYQLGWTGQEIPEDESSSFKSAKESCNTSLHVRRGDIIIMATDGLFDNVDLEEIRAIVLDWEERNGFIRDGDTAARERRWSMGNSRATFSAEKVSELAESLCIRARENSLLRDVDSPFAVRV
jgi:protein phosphatase PTC7